MVSEIFALLAIRAESDLSCGVVENATKKNDSLSRAKTGGFGRVS